ncbi:hypothetical protein ACFC1T_09110 [Kitasatospora sp. NPDC056076]|uniref:hypothetical protein n=1 Tax=Kitasatospora sp. NPDC056076 TaxID=3345703 RepID=UPI0035DB89B5
MSSNRTKRLMLTVLVERTYSARTGIVVEAPAELETDDKEALRLWLAESGHTRRLVFEEPSGEVASFAVVVEDAQGAGVPAPGTRLPLRHPAFDLRSKSHWWDGDAWRGTGVTEREVADFLTYCGDGARLLLRALSCNQMRVMDQEMVNGFLGDAGAVELPEVFGDFEAACALVRQAMPFYVWQRPDGGVVVAMRPLVAGLFRRAIALRDAREVQRRREAAR